MFLHIQLFFLSLREIQLITLLPTLPKSSESKCLLLYKVHISLFRYFSFTGYYQI